MPPRRPLLDGKRRANKASRHLQSIPGIEPITASALVASIADPSIFKSGRELAAWIGLVPRQNSTGGRERLGRISKQGDHYLRWLLVAGSMTVIRHAKRCGTANPWLAERLIGRVPSCICHHRNLFVGYPAPVLAYPSMIRLCRRASQEKPVQRAAIEMECCAV